MVKRLLFSIVGIIGIVQSSIAQSDTIKVHDLQEVEVRASAPSASFLATAPQQAFSSDKLEKINALQVSDAMKYFSGVQVKDYGGVGGLKTVSIRSLGANYTAVAYDGMTVSDYQTGQIDLGRFSLDNVAQVRLNTGGSDDIFQPARNQALSGLIQIVSQSFIPTETKRSEWKAGVKTGSWQLFNPFLSHSRALNDVFTLRCSGEYLSSKGDYPYRLDNEERRRNHSEVTNQRWEAHLTGKFGKNKTLTFKSVYFDSDRNLPGSAISGNTYAGERMKDRNIFSQINYTQYLTNRWSFQANARFDYTAMQYSHLLYPEIGSRYYQREAYLSATVLYKSSEHLSFSWANDGSYGDFKAIHKDKSLFPSRCLWLSALSGKYETPVLTLNASLLSQLEQRQHVSPYLGISLQPLNSLPMTCF